MRNTLAALFFISSLLRLFAQDINFDHLDGVNGLSQISVMSIYQDEHGYMWFGTREGLNRFDGEHIDVYQAKESDALSLPSNIINTVCGDNNGSLYILCGYQYLVVYDKKLNTFQSVHEHCQTISQGNKALWFAADNVIKQYDYVQKSYADYYHVDQRLPVKSIFESNQSKLYIGTERGLAVLDENKIFHILIPDIRV